MRVLFVTISEKTHLFSLVPLAWALRAAGHEVQVASNPALTEPITRCGLTAVGVGTDHNMPAQMARHRAEHGGEVDDWSVTDPEKLTYEEVSQLYSIAAPYAFAIYNDSMMDGLIDYARSWRPDLVVWDPVTYAGPVAARVSGAAHARLLWCVDFWSAMRRAFLTLRPPTLAPGEDDGMAEWLDPVLARHGHRFDEEILNGQWTVDQIPDSMQLPLDVHRLAMRYVPFNGPAVIEEWLRERPPRPRVCLTLGISGTQSLGGDFVSVGDLLDAVAGLDVEVVATLAAAQRAKLRSVPDNVRVAEFVALNALLPTCTAIIHHGGFGTCATAMRCGVPQVVVPNSYANAALMAQGLERIGAGLSVPARELTPDVLRAKLHRLLAEPAFPEAAGRLAEEMAAAPAPLATVPVIEELVTAHRTRSGGTPLGQKSEALPHPVRVG
jgi:glycosyltransferase (activator-dependent family)